MTALELDTLIRIEVRTLSGTVAALACLVVLAAVSLSLVWDSICGKTTAIDRLTVTA
jgi:hypothetical protein